MFFRLKNQYDIDWEESEQQFCLGDKTDSSQGERKINQRALEGNSQMPKKTADKKFQKQI